MSKQDIEELDVKVVRVGRDRLVMLGVPEDDETVPEGHHNCDYMGCGSVGLHVVARAVILRADGDPAEWTRSEAMLRTLASTLGFEVTRKTFATPEVTP